MLGRVGGDKQRFDTTIGRQMPDVCVAFVRVWFCEDFD